MLGLITYFKTYNSLVIFFCFIFSCFALALRPYWCGKCWYLHCKQGQWKEEVSHKSSSLEIQKLSQSLKELLCCFCYSKEGPKKFSSEAKWYSSGTTLDIEEMYVSACWRVLGGFVLEKPRETAPWLYILLFTLCMLHLNGKATDNQIWSYKILTVPT